MPRGGKSWYRIIAVIAGAVCFNIRCSSDIGTLLRDRRVITATSDGYRNPAGLLPSDFNGDGFADTIIAAPNGSDPALSGIVYILYGQAAGINPPGMDNCVYPACTEIENPADEAGTDLFGFGRSYAVLGDVNGDGLPDFAAGAPRNGVGGTPSGMANDRGAVYVFYGNAAGITSHPRDAGTTPYPCTGIADGCSMVQNPQNQSFQFGITLAGAGDINGDGYADLLVGAPYDGSGKVYIFYGSASGVQYRPFTGSDEICSLPTCAVLTDPGGLGQFGSAIVGNADLNGDGFVDVAVGNIQGSGRVYIFYGAASGITERPTPGYSCAGSADACVEIRNPRSNARFASALAVADLNRDGFADLIVGAPENSATAQNEGAMYAYLGSSAGLPPHLSGSGTYNCTGSCFEIRNPTDEMGGEFAAALMTPGDLNGDGFSDIVIGAPFNEPDGTNDNRGIAYVFFGSTNGPVRHASAGASFTCAGLPDCTEIRYPRTDANAQFGLRVFSTGDVNRDGYADFYVSAPTGASGSVGVAYLYFGKMNGPESHTSLGGAYSCSGFPDCIEINNPRSGSGRFGFGQ